MLSTELVNHTRGSMSLSTNLNLILLYLCTLFGNILTDSVTDNISDNKTYCVQKKAQPFIKLDITCKQNKPSVWCLPFDYDKKIEPWKYRHISSSSMPWNYYFDFYIYEVQEVNDKRQTITLDMYFIIKWFEPRLEINLNSSHDPSSLTGDDYISVPLEDMNHFWYPDLEIYGLKRYQSQNILKPMASFKIKGNKLLRYSSRVNMILSCQMEFAKYPLDSQYCPFRVGSYYHPQNIVSCTSEFEHEYERQKALQYEIKVEELPSDYDQYQFSLMENVWATCGFKIVLKRTKIQNFFQVYLTCTLLVIASWVSFIINPHVVPGRMGLLVTIFLVLINIFIGVKNDAPISKGLNAVDVFLVVCISEVFTAFLEYAVVLMRCRNEVEPISSNLGTSKNVSSHKINQITVATNDSKNEAPKDQNNKLDKISLIFYPISFICFIIIYCYVYLT